MGFCGKFAAVCSRGVKQKYCDENSHFFFFSEDYITETESEEEESVRENEVQFIKPKIWESGGGEWKKVTDR